MVHVQMCTNPEITTEESREGAMEKAAEALTAYMAKQAAKYDTVIALAFRKALGVSRKPPRGKVPRGASNSRYDGAERLMAQRYGARPR